MRLKENIRYLVLSKSLLVREFFRRSNFSTVILGSSILVVTVAATAMYFRFDKGKDIPFFHIVDKEEIQYWGQLGDFFGGILNPLLSFMALMAVLYTVRLQREELRQAREETRLANKIQDKQTEIFERQNFEALLFRLLDVHVKITEKLSIRNKDEESTFFELAGYAKEKIIWHNVNSKFKREKKLAWEASRFLEKQHRISVLSSVAEEVLEHREPNKLSHYYRNMYQILKVIDNYKGGEKGAGDDTARYFLCRQYSNMLRALLTNEELILLALNCLTKSGEGMKKYVEKYSLLKHLDTAGYLADRDLALGAFNELAFTDYEKIRPAVVASFYK